MLERNDKGQLMSEGLPLGSVEWYALHNSTTNPAQKERMDNDLAAAMKDNGVEPTAEQLENRVKDA